MKKENRFSQPNYLKPSGFDDEMPTYEENLYFKNEAADDFFGESGKVRQPSGLCGGVKGHEKSKKK